VSVPPPAAPREAAAAPPAEPSPASEAPPPVERPPAEPPRASEAPPPEAPPPEGSPAAEPAEPERRRRRLLTVTLPVVAVTLVAGIVGYVIANGGGGGDDDGGGAQQPGAAAPTTASPLRTIAERDLRDLRCTVTPAAGGADVLANAECVPKSAQDAAARRVSLTLFSSRQALDQIFSRSLALAGRDASGASGCPTGRWYRDAAGTRPGGRSFCGPGGVRIVWTDEDALVLGEAAGPRPAQLAAWWQEHRDLEAGNQG